MLRSNDDGTVGMRGMLGGAEGECHQTAVPRVQTRTRQDPGHIGARSSQETLQVFSGHHGAPLPGPVIARRWSFRRCSKWQVQDAAINHPAAHREFVGRYHFTVSSGPSEHSAAC